jgi:hypothetical protein
MSPENEVPVSSTRLCGGSSRFEASRRMSAAAAVDLPPLGPKITVFSGGSAFNSIVEEIHRYSNQISHIIGISDNGGSTREVLRVLGGPAIGDIRSRLVRLAAAGCPSESNRAVRKLLEYRLPQTSKEEARQQFQVFNVRSFFSTFVLYNSCFLYVVSVTCLIPCVCSMLCMMMSPCSFPTNDLLNYTISTICLSVLSLFGFVSTVILRLEEPYIIYIIYVYMAIHPFVRLPSLTLFRSTRSFF